MTIPAGLSIEDWVNYNELLITRQQRGRLGRLNSEFVAEIEAKLRAAEVAAAEKVDG